MTFSYITFLSSGQEKEAYSLKVDCWSLGVILYIMVSGTAPFTEDRNCGMKLRDQILKGSYHFYPSLFDMISKECKNLIERCLKVDPLERISAAEILEHPWLQDKLIVKRAKYLMSLQLRGKKRRIEKEDSEGSCGPPPLKRDVDVSKAELQRRFFEDLGGGPLILDP